MDGGVGDGDGCGRGGLRGDGLGEGGPVKSGFDGRGGDRSCDGEGGGFDRGELLLKMEISLQIKTVISLQIKPPHLLYCEMQPGREGDGRKGADKSDGDAEDGGIEGSVEGGIEGGVEGSVEGGDDLVTYEQSQSWGQSSRH